MLRDCLPLGLLSYKHLSWEDKTYYGKQFRAVKIPKDRLNDFVVGEGLAHNVKFSSRNTHSKRKGIPVGCHIILDSAKYANCITGADRCAQMLS